MVRAVEDMLLGDWRKGKAARELSLGGKPGLGRVGSAHRGLVVRNVLL